MAMSKHEKLFRSINLYPPMIGAGIRVVDFSKDMTTITVELKLTWWNKNVVGTQFGGSLYMMTDPFFMAIMMINLGRDYIVWDKSAHIDFLKPGKSTVRDVFHIPQEEIIRVKTLADKGEKVTPIYEVEIRDRHDTLIAKVKKEIYIRKKT